MGPVGGSSSCQCQGVAGCASRSPLLPVLSVRDHGGRVLRQCHRGPLSTQGGGGGDRSPALDTVALGILRWAESLRIRLAQQFIPGIRNVLPDSLSRPHQLPSSAWSLNLDVFRSLWCRWPVMFDLCATSDHHRCSIFFSPYRDPLSAGKDALLQSWDSLLAFPPWSVLPGVFSWRALFRRGPFFPGCWRNLGCLTGPSSPSSPSTGLSVLGSWTSSSCRRLLQCLFQCAQTSSSSLGLVAATRVSTGWPFMPGDCPAPHQDGWFLLGSGCSGFVGAPSIIALHLPAQVVGLPVMVLLSGPLHLAAIPLQGKGFPLVDRDLTEGGNGEHRTLQMVTAGGIIATITLSFSLPVFLPLP